MHVDSLAANHDTFSLSRAVKYSALSYSECLIIQFLDNLVQTFQGYLELS
jgi:hypothetical protein